MSAPRKRFCPRGHDTSIKGRDTQSHCRVCVIAVQAAYDRSPAGKARDARYAKSPASRARRVRWEASPKNRRYKLLYNLTTRYSRNQDRIIGRLEEKLEALLANP